MKRKRKKSNGAAASWPRRARITVGDRRGLHGRVLALWSACLQASGVSARLGLVRGGRTVDLGPAKRLRIAAVLGGGAAAYGTEVEVAARGPGAEEALRITADVLGGEVSGDFGQRAAELLGGTREASASLRKVYGEATKQLAPRRNLEGLARRAGRKT